MASITIDGRATGAAELKFTPSGQAVLNFSLAENHRKKVGDQWEDDGTTFYRVAVWGKRAESLVDSIDKGTPVLVSGRLRTREYVTRDGGTGQSLDVTADVVGLIPRGERSPAQPASRSQAADPWGTSTPATDEPPF